MVHVSDMLNVLDNFYCRTGREGMADGTLFRKGVPKLDIAQKVGEGVLPEKGAWY